MKRMNEAIKKKTIAVTGEGAVDYGKRIGAVWQWGAVKGYIDGIAKEAGVELALEVIERAEVDKFKFTRSIKGLKGKALPAARFYIRAREKGFHNGIFYCDADKEAAQKNTVHKAVARYYSVKQEVEKGLQDGFIPMIGLRMIESWVLGDLNAIEVALHTKIKEKDKLKNPESLWGNEKDPESNHPKCYLQRAIRQSDKRLREFKISAETAYEIASLASCDTMNRICSVSYKDFYKELTKLIEGIHS